MVVIATVSRVSTTWPRVSSCCLCCCVNEAARLDQSARSLTGPKGTARIEKPHQQNKTLDHSLSSLFRVVFSLQLTASNIFSHVTTNNGVTVLIKVIINQSHPKKGQNSKILNFADRRLSTVGHVIGRPRNFRLSLERSSKKIGQSINCGHLLLFSKNCKLLCNLS